MSDLRDMCPDCQRPYSVRDDMDWPLPNVWVGVTVEDQKHADGRTWDES